MNVKKILKIRNATVRGRSGLEDIVKTVRTHKWKWAGHVARLDNENGRRKLLRGNQPGDK